MGTTTITIPNIVLYGVAAILLSGIWFYIADRLIGRVWTKLARREGNIVLTSRYFWPSLICDGPVAWLMALTEIKRLRRERKESWARRHDPVTRAKIQASILKNREGWLAD